MKCKQLKHSAVSKVRGGCLFFTGAGVGTRHSPGLDLVHGHAPVVTLVHATVGTEVVIGHTHRFQTVREIKEIE